MKRLAIFIIFAASCMAACYASSLTAQADSAYNCEDYKTAARLYESALEADGPVATVFYNLGNTWYRLGRPGNAILNYERALKLDPSFADARTNLEFVRGTIVDKPEDDSSFLGNLYESIVMAASPDAWAWITLCSFMLLLSAAALYIFTQRVGLRKIGFFSGIVLFFVTGVLISVSYNSVRRARSSDRAIVMVPTTNLTSAPRAPKDKTEKVVPVHEGTLLRIIDSVSTPADPASHTYYDVKINNSTRAWVKAADVERI